MRLRIAFCTSLQFQSVIGSKITDAARESAEALLAEYPLVSE